MIPDSTNPRVMADNIRALEKKIESGGGGGSDLPDIGPSDYGSYLAVDEEGKWGLDKPKTGIDYSTTEADTGLKWIDGRPVFQKSYSGVIARGEYEYYNMIDLGTIDAVSMVGFDASLFDANGNVIPFGSSLTGSNQGYTDYSWAPCIKNGHLYIYLNGSTSAVGYNYNLTIKYVKAATTETRKTKKSK